MDEGAHDDAHGAEADERESRDTLAIAHAPDFVGMTPAEAAAHARSLGLQIRLRSEGWYTSEYRIGRVTADVVAGRVVTATAG